MCSLSRKCKSLYITPHKRFKTRRAYIPKACPPGPSCDPRMLNVCGLAARQTSGRFGSSVLAMRCLRPPLPPWTPRTNPNVWLGYELVFRSFGSNVLDRSYHLWTVFTDLVCFFAQPSRPTVQADGPLRLLVPKSPNSLPGSAP